MKCKDKILLVTEATKQIASGHLFECLECEKYFVQNGLDVSLMVNEDMPQQFKARITSGYITYKSNIQEESEFLTDYINRNKIDKVIFNLREIKNSFIAIIRKEVNCIIICIDEFGNRKLDADIIINPMIDEDYWNYQTDAIVYAGLQYLVLPMNLQKYCGEMKQINNDIRTVTVSMGGVDLKNTTQKLAGWLYSISRQIKINLVIGGGYLYEKDLIEEIKNKQEIQIYCNIPYLSKLFFESDLAVCAGGNTLHELAVLGVPTIVIPSMPHELKNGKAYEKRGFSLCGSIASEITYNEFYTMYCNLKNKIAREEMCKKGKDIADGKGYERIFKIITQ